MITDNQQIHDLAVTALKLMLSQRGASHQFPPDAIWQYVPENAQIKSTKKPHQPMRLVREGYLRDTGAKTRAQSGPRAGSTTNLYAFGHRLVPATSSQTPLSAATHSGLETTADAISGTTASDALKAMQLAMECEGYLISVAELANFFLAMTVSPLVILSGISGTGKSLLPRKFATHTKSKFHPVQVQPQWSDNSDLFGYVPTLSPTTYVPGKLIAGLRDAHSNSDTLVIVLLDEMNLAPVEHYFSDFLSVAESRSRKDDRRIGSDPLPVELPALRASDVDDPEADLRGVELPPNLRLVGTANMDETTNSFSPKVLDRAFTIEFDDPDLTLFASGTPGDAQTFEVLSKAVIELRNPITVQEARQSSQELFDYIAVRLSEIQDILAPAGIKFGYRTRDAILLYIHFWQQNNLADVLAGNAAFDFCILQKILPKVAGSGEALAESLDKLAAWLQGPAAALPTGQIIEAAFAGPMERSHQKVLRMREILKIDGSTRFWGV